ncbi:uncharacterized protein LOC131598452 [Vicia villosa]|uniref:uncharacterized protein LOC131598452 n=1 Tax=Vicia villosa TaxID=3911 RepID=UPI00273B91B7|nr:uncharacterized protein LOC131598452 [Vicia villosa]
MLIHGIEEKEKILMQRDKINWLKLGDGNNAFFHAIMRGKNKQNGIHKLVDSNGITLTEFKYIEGEILRFYKNLVGTSIRRLLHVDIVAFRNGTQLKETSKESLIQSIIENKVWNILKIIGETKSLGVDGFNSKFFKSTWDIIKVDMMTAIQDLF